MDIKSKVILSLVILVVLSSVAITVKKYYFDQDFLVRSYADCDPTEDPCFISQCNPDEEECSDIQEENLSYFKIYEKSAAMLPVCPYNDPQCTEFSCDPAQECIEILCDATTAIEMSDTGSCSDPDIFSKEEIETGDETFGTDEGNSLEEEN